MAQFDLDENEINLLTAGLVAYEARVKVGMSFKGTPKRRALRATTLAAIETLHEKLSPKADYGELLESHSDGH